MMAYKEVKDSGSKQEYETGSQRDNPMGKGRYDLITPIALERLAQHYENGARKYADRNWEKGQPLSRYVDAALRHINKWRLGHRDEDHLIAAVWNLMGLVHTEEMVQRGVLPTELCDIPTYLGNSLEEV